MVPARPVTATVTLAAEPASARILVDDVDLGCNPCKLGGKVGESRRVRVRAAGHAEAQLELTLDTDRTERVVLSALPPEPPLEDAGVAVTVDGGVPRFAPAPSQKVRKSRPGALDVDESNPYR